MCIIHAHIKVKPERRIEFFKLAKNLVIHSKAEEGNITYHLNEDTE